MMMHLHFLLLFIIVYLFDVNTAVTAANREDANIGRRREVISRSLLVFTILAYHGIHACKKGVNIRGSGEATFPDCSR